MIKRFSFLILFITISSAKAGIAATPSEHIRKLVEDISANVNVTVQGEELYCLKLLPDFYIKRQFEPAWQGNQNVGDFIDELSRASEVGLVANDYHFQLIHMLSEKGLTPIEKAEFDLLLTDAFILYSSHLLNGKVNPETLDSEWKATRRENNSIEILEKAISGKNIRKFLAGQEPLYESYQGLKRALVFYRAIQADGGWPQIPDGETLKPGMQDSLRVPKLIQRLISTSDLKADYVNIDNTYTLELSEAVKIYQSRNGLNTDGQLGKMSTASLNISVQQRIDQITLNLERFRWISHELGDKFVFVNIAEFQMRVFEKGEVVFREKVIVGKPFRKTPVFSSSMTYFVLNPYWTVPPTILYNDILPEMKKNTGYLAAKNIKVLDGYGSNAQVIDPSTLDWSRFSRNNFPYTLRQEPGKTNALGQVKFMFPNKFNVYIHDTPSKELFNRAERIFSSGCVRLENPMSFVEYLIKNQPDVSMERVHKILAEGKEYTVLLKKPLNVHIQYLTSWVENDIVNFRNDIYERDKAVLNALKEQPSIL